MHTGVYTPRTSSVSFHESPFHSSFIQNLLKTYNSIHANSLCRAKMYSIYKTDDSCNQSR